MARNVRIFGSAARGDDTTDSDLDVLVDMEEGRSLIDHVALKQELEELLGQEVDVVTEASLHPKIRERMLREAVPLEWVLRHMILCICSINFRMVVNQLGPD